ncbi:uncharacterized protein prob1 isoform X2 [Toxotes jaculatrix]|nr:uncharacterized protein prob1 isoform X2 [Toxotes jaculatrix]
MQEEEEEEGSISDWSEEDLSLHFSPSVIHPSDDEESESESGFKCVDVTVETQVTGQEGEGLKMVPKRQIHLKKKDTENITNQKKPERRQMIMKDGPSEVGGAHRHPDKLLRQHSMPTSFHTRSTISGDGDSYRVYRGLVAGASQGFQVGGNSEAPRRLQKSFSLDETKTKMASCIIKSVLSKKMQVEQSSSKTSHLKKTPETLRVLPPPADQQRVREGGGASGGVFKAPVHVVRDVRSLVKNTYSLSFSMATTSENHKPTSFKVIGQEDSPPPTYQQAVGVKGHHMTKTNSSRGNVTKVAASLDQSQNRKKNDTLSHPITQRRSSEPVRRRRMLLDPPLPTTPLVGQSERDGGASHLAGTSLPPSVFIQPPRPPSSTPRHPQGTQPPFSAEEQRSLLDVSPQSGPSSSQPILQSCFYTAPTLHPHLGKVSYVHSPLNYIQTQLQPPQPATTLHLLRSSEEKQNRTTGDTLDQPDRFINTCPLNQTRSVGDQEGHAVTAATPKQQQQQEQHHLQQQVFQGLLPAQVGSDFLIDAGGSAVPPGALLGGPTPCHVMLEPKSGRCYYVDPPPLPQRKMLLDPETGQFIQVFLPAASSTPSAAVFPVCYTNPAPAVISATPTMLQVGGANPTVLSVMRFQPSIAFSSLYAPPCLPFTLHAPSGNFTHTAP